MLTVMIPALNEELHLRDAALTVIEAARLTQVWPIEIIIVNDGSTDRTAEVIRRLESDFPFVRSIHHAQNQGLGQSFLDALEIARYEKMTLFPGDNNADAYTAQNLMKNAYRAELVLAYMLNTECRTLFRHCLSLLFFLVYTLTFNVHVKYVHGLPVYPVRRVRGINLYSRQYSLFVELNVKLLRQGITYYEVDGFINPAAGKSSALSMKNLFNAGATYLHLVYEVYFKERKRFSARPRRVIPDALRASEKEREAWVKREANAGQLTQ